MRLIALIAMALMLAACAPALDYRTLDTQIGSGNCAGALEYIGKSEGSYGSRDRLLYLMDSGMAHLLCGQYEKSAHFFEEADRLGQELWTESVSQQAASLVTNEYALSYAGEDFERVMVNLFASLDYALRDDYEGALVEARRINSKLTEMNSKYEKKNVYKEDAFARHLSALLYEAEAPSSSQNIDDAFIDYHKASELYSSSYASEFGLSALTSSNPFCEDYARIAEAADRRADLRAACAGAARGITQRQAKDMARVVLVHLAGKVPEKQEFAITVPLPDRTYVSIAVPYYEKSAATRPMLCTESSLLLEGPGGSAVAETRAYENIRAIAVRDLEDRRGRLIAKTVLRIAAKRALAKKAGEKNELLGIASQAASMLTERADLRSWRTLPGEVRLGRAFVQPGTYKVSTRSCMGQSGAQEITLKPGQTKFILLNTMHIQ